ncbi:hypothetical protein MMPV_007621 [Pyropia vietnamensis]
MRFFIPSWLRHAAPPGGAPSRVAVSGDGAAGTAGAPSVAGATGASRGSKQLPAVFSIDLQPGVGPVRRLATAGQDACVMIWNVEVLKQSTPVMPAEVAGGRGGGGGGGGGATATTANGKEAGGAAGGGDEGTVPPKGALLASLSFHSAAINCVRWSPDGALLASAGDDGVVLLYECLRSAVGDGGGSGGGGGAGGTQGGALTGFGAATALESWRCRRPLRGHTGDVTDLAWSPDCARLASSSIDNTVLVWAAADGRRVATLAGHAGLVKGVAWDPVGRFIASQGDDRSVIVWRTADWKVEKRLEEPFADAVHHVHSLSFFLRLSWSPCGSQLLTPNAFRRPNHVAPMFSRASGFTSQMDFVGHRGPVVATRFSPRLYVPLGEPTPALAAPPGGGGGGAGEAGVTKTANGGGTGAVAGAEGESGWKDSASYTCLALGSKDRGATVWKASAATPFLSLAQMFDSDLVDLSWGGDGYTVAASSTDGRVVLMQFEPRELGVVVPRAQEARILGTIARSFGGTASVAQLPESTTTLAMEDALMRQQPPALPQVGDAGRVAANAPTAAPDPSRKRKALDVDGGGGAPPPTAATAAAPYRPLVRISQQREVRKGGKRRIIPTAVPAPGAAPRRALPSVLPGGPAPPPPDGLRGGVEAPTAAAAVARPPPAAGPTAAAATHSRGFGAVAAAPAPLPSLPRAPVTVDVTHSPLDRHGAHPIAANGVGSRGSLPPAPDPASALDALHRVNLPRPLSPAALAAVERGNGGVSVAAASIRGLRTPLLPPAGETAADALAAVGSPTAGATLVRAIDMRTPPTLVEVVPPVAADAIAAAATLLVSRGGVVVWRDFIPAVTPVVAVAGAAGRFVAVATADGLLRLYSGRGGRRLAPPLALDSPPHVMEADVVGGVGGAGGVVRLGGDEAGGSSEDDDVGTGAERGGGGGSATATAAALPPVLAGRTTGRRGERWHLLLVTRSGQCTVYDVRTLRLVVTRCAAVLLARVHPAGGAAGGGDGSIGGRGAALPATEVYRSIVLGRVTPSGEPLLALSDGSTFLYDRRLAAWLRIAGGGDATYSEFTFAAATANAAGSGGLVHRLQARAAATEAAAASGSAGGGASAGGGGGGGGGAATSAALTALAAEADGRRAAVETLGHLETLVWTAARLRSAAELKYYLACYAARLASVAGDAAGGVGVGGVGGGGGGGTGVSPAGGGDRDPDAAAAATRLRELCDGLMEAAATGAAGGPAGVSLLRSTVLPVVSANRGMQRLVAGYTDSLREIPSAAGAAGGKRP